jgi:4-hydroxy-tetrahydrodipicolinate synthase
MLKGSMPALVTPFKNGELDLDTLKKLVDWHVDQGSHGLVPVGTTGESPTLSHEEHETVVEEVVNAAAGRIPVVAGAGSNNTAESLRFMEHAKSVGADAALVVTPYYNKPTQAGLIAHFKTLADACDLPIVIYNIPGRSVVDMSPATMGELAKHPNIIGVKDATGDLARVCSQRITCGTDFLQISGEDATAHGFNAQGGVGCISVTANVAPALCSQLQEATLAGDYAKALEIQDRLMPLHHAIFTEPGLVGAKYGMSLLGLCSDEVRLPLTPLSEGTKALIKDAMVHAGLL